MNWLIAPNAFKGSIEADDAARIIQNLISERYKDDVVSAVPIADGGDGTCYLLNEQLGLRRFSATVCGPTGRPMKGFFGYDSSTATAYLDVSTVSGIKWLGSNEKDPWVCSTYGTGELILEAIAKGAKNIVLGLGGSATIDLGTGILAALGVVFLDEKGRELTQFSPGFLQKIAHIQLSGKLPVVSFTCLCDVSNPFFGDNGAIPVFGPQKGLKPADLAPFLEASKNVYRLFNNKRKNKINDQPCFGAAGGIALGLTAFFPTNISQGANYFFEKVGMKEKIASADLILTGEGRYDHQSANGKGSFELLKLARSKGKKIWLITSGSEADEAGFDEVLKLPDLDFDLPGVEGRAEENLKSVVNKKLNEMGF
jgi:glycerate kinase